MRPTYSTSRLFGALGENDEFPLAVISVRGGPSPSPIHLTAR
jgi:hypothetical protein